LGHCGGGNQKKKVSQHVQENHAQKASQVMKENQINKASQGL